MELTKKQARVIEIMRAEDAPMFPADVAEHDADLFEKGAKSVSPLFNGLVKNGLVSKEDAQCEAVDKEGKAVVKTLKRYSLTDEGKTAEITIKA